MLPKSFTMQPMAGAGERRWEREREGRKEEKNTYDKLVS